MNLENYESEEKLQNDRKELIESQKKIKVGINPITLNALIKIKSYENIEEFKTLYVKNHANLSKEELIIKLKILDEFKDFVENN